MSKPTTTPSQPRSTLLALETLSDDVAALRADLVRAHADTQTWRTLALEAIGELHRMTREHDESRSEVAS